MVAWTLAELERMIELIRARQDGFRVSAGTAPLIITALETHLAQARKPYIELRIEQWDDKGLHVVECLAVCSHVTIARAAFRAAVEVRPGAMLTLRDKARVIASAGRD